MAYFKYPYIDDEEREIMESLDRGEWSPLSDADYKEHMAALVNAARAYFGLPPEENPVIPPRRRPLSLAELTAELPVDTTPAIPYLDEAERAIFAAYRNGDPVAASEGRLTQIVCHVLAILDAETPTDGQTPPLSSSLSSPPSPAPTPQPSAPSAQGSVIMSDTILEQYIARHPGSAARYREAVSIFPGGVTHDNRYAEPFPLYITHGEGPRKWDVDGHEYIDYVSGHGALILGHSHPAIADAVTEQIRRGTHLGACTDEELRWAKAIMTLMPSVERIRFHSSGTEATLMAMRLARAYTGRSKVIKLQDHFHGWHDYAMAGSDRPAPGIPAAAWGSMVIVPAGDLDAVQQAMASDPDIAAIILEPTGAHYGQLPFAVPAYLSGLRQLCDRHGVILIFDEVVTGFRASPGGAQVRYGVSPDLTTMAKIVAGALPGGAVGGKADIVDLIAQRGDPEWDNTRRVYHPGTFNANPLSAAAGATCLELIAAEPVNARADAMAARLKAGLNAAFTKMEVSGHAYGIASMLHFTLADGDFDHEHGPAVNRRIKAAAATPAVTAIKRGLQNHGVDIMGRDAFLVSSTHTEADIDATLAAFEATLAQVRAEGLA